MVDVVEAVERPDLALGSDQVGGGVGGPEKHGGAHPQDFAHVGVDHPAVTGHRDPLADVGGNNSFDHIDHSVTELLVAFAAGVHVPCAVAHETLAGTLENQFAEHISRVGVLGWSRKVSTSRRSSTISTSS